MFITISRMCEWLSACFLLMNEARKLPRPNHAINIKRAKNPPTRLSRDPSAPKIGPPPRFPKRRPSCPMSDPRYETNAIKRMIAHAEKADIRFLFEPALATRSLPDQIHRRTLLQ